MRTSRRFVSVLFRSLEKNQRIINDRIYFLSVQAQYAVRGELVIRALAHAEALKRGEKRPYTKLTVRFRSFFPTLELFMSF